MLESLSNTLEWFVFFLFSFLSYTLLYPLSSTSRVCVTKRVEQSTDFKRKKNRDPVNTSDPKSFPREGNSKKLEEEDIPRDSRYLPFPFPFSYIGFINSSGNVG